MSSISTDIPSRMLCGCQCQDHWFTPSAQSTEPDFISQEISRLDEVLNHFHTLKSQRLRQFNKLHPSTKDLPNEILLFIFEHFCSLVEPHQRPQLTLRAVCGLWYDIVEVSPQLWKKFDLVLSDEVLPKAASLLEAYKTHTTASLDSLRLDFGMFQWTVNTTRWQERKPPIQSLLHSIKTLSSLHKIELLQPPVDLLSIINNNPDLPIREVHLSNQPRLLTGETTLPQFSYPWLSLTTLKVTRVPVNICTDLLIGCPNLIQYTSYDPLRFSDDCREPNAQHHSRKLHFPNMQDLTWYHTWTTWDNNLLTCYRFPGLRCFTWHGHEHYHKFEYFREFVEALPEVCRVLVLSAGKERNGKLKKRILECLDWDHPFETLVCRGFVPESIWVVLERLADPAFLPSLTLFKWEQGSGDGYYMYKERIGKLVGMLGDVLRCRNEMGVMRGGGGGGFRMEIGGLKVRTEYERKEVYKCIRKQEVGGDDWAEGEGVWFQFEIGEGGEWVMTLV